MATAVAAASFVGLRRTGGESSRAAAPAVRSVSLGGRGKQLVVRASVAAEATLPCRTFDGADAGTATLSIKTAGDTAKGVGHKYLVMAMQNRRAVSFRGAAPGAQGATAERGGMPCCRWGTGAREGGPSSCRGMAAGGGNLCLSSYLVMCSH